MQKEWELREVLRELHNLTGFRLSLHDTDFKELEAYPKELSSYCRLVQSVDAGLCRCHENDRKAFEHVQVNPGVHLYKCCFGLYEVVSPLYVLGNLVGYLMMGQSTDDLEVNRPELKKNAAIIIQDFAAIEDAISSVPVCRRDVISSCVKIFDICAQYITLSNHFLKDGAGLADNIKKHIDENYHSSITIDSICRMLFCSRTGAMTTFKQRFGISIIEYLTGVRIQAAERLLSGTNRPIAEIAAACGYNDPNYFCKVFLKHRSVTPTKWRKSVQK